MISAFSIILEDDILFCSKKKRYNAFEIVLFVDKLLRSINPKNTWRLEKICLKKKKRPRRRIIVKQVLTKNNKNLFFCIIGKFNVDSIEAPKLLDEFSKQVNLQFHKLEELKSASEEPTFYNIIKLITDYLKERYLESLEDEIIFEKSRDDSEISILYNGISVQGLPIISHLFDKNLLLDREKTNENVELFVSDLSGKLATISMNTQIRAKTKIKEIHIFDNGNKETEKIIFFGNVKAYTLDFFASGDFYKLRDFFQQLKAKLNLEPIFQEEFLGNLKPFKHLKQHLIDVIKELVSYLI